MNPQDIEIAGGGDSYNYIGYTGIIMLLERV